MIYVLLFAEKCGSLRPFLEGLGVAHFAAVVNLNLELS